MRKSAGLLIFRRTPGLEFLLLHMGGPFWARKDSGAWTIPKGEFEDEDPLTVACRECQEETGLTPRGNFMQLSPVRQSGGKIVYAWAIESDCDPALIRSNTFEMEWPPGSGERQRFPEVDRAAWFSPEAARVRIVKGQQPLMDQLIQKLAMS